MNRTELEQLPPLVDLPTAAQVLGIGRTLAYELVKADRWPTTVVRVGKLIRIPTAALMRLVDGGPVQAPASHELSQSRRDGLSLDDMGRGPSSL
jgi:predicted DNA-binding transcriptional regulator AlpA